MKYYKLHFQCPSVLPIIIVRIAFVAPAILFSLFVINVLLAFMVFFKSKFIGFFL